MRDISVLPDITYRRTPQRELLLDLYIPTDIPFPPLVMYIPVRGMRDSPREKAPRWITEHGFALVCIECRGSSEAIAPAQIFDCKAALRWLRVHATEYGYNPEAIGVWGHSAGGLLAALLATSGDCLELRGDGDNTDVTSLVQAACDECGAPHNMAYFFAPDIQAQFPIVTENLRLYLGGPIEKNAELGRLVSPSTYVSRACPPMLLIHGDEDKIVPVEETIGFHEALLAAGADSMLKVLPCSGHSWDKSLTRDDIVTFFKRTLS